MSAKRSKPRAPRAPKYLHHRPSNRAFTYVYEGGKRRQVYLGTWESPESHREFRRVASLHLAGKPVATSRRRPAEDDDGPTVAELVAAFLLWADKRYRDRNGLPTGQADNYRFAVRPLLKLYRDHPTKLFDITHLSLVREEMEAQKRADGETPKLARSVINDRINRIRHVFRRGAVEFKLVPPAVWNDLRALDPLQAGQSAARETDPVPAVAVDHVEAILPHLPPTIAAMVQTQYLTAARPGEIVRMRPRDIDRSGDLWLYCPPIHKNAFRGHKRRIRINAKGQALLRPFLLRPEDSPMFSPIEAEDWRKKQKAAGRKSPPSTNRRRDEERRQNPKRSIAESYSTSTYRKAIWRACDAAEIPRWSPNQLRHAGLTLAARLGGRMAAKAIGDHRDFRSTDRYIEDDDALADDVSKRMG